MLRTASRRSGAAGTEGGEDQGQGQEGEGPAAKPAEPAPAAIETLALPKARHLAFDVGLCVVTTTGHLQCLQPNNPCELDTPWPGLSKVDIVDGHCARSTDGTVRCWQSIASRARSARSTA